VARSGGPARAGAAQEADRRLIALRALTLAELADEAGAPVDLLEWLVGLGQLRPLDDGRFDPRDAAILSTVGALLDSGIERDDLAWAIEGAGGGFTSSPYTPFQRRICPTKV